MQHKVKKASIIYKSLYVAASEIPYHISEGIQGYRETIKFYSPAPAAHILFTANFFNFEKKLSTFV